MSASSFALELLDTESGHVHHTWRLGGNAVFQLGRSTDCDVVFSSPIVSRTHACLRWGESGWELSAISSSGVFVDGERVDHLVLTEGVVFRLSRLGPMLRFRTQAVNDSGTHRKTMSFDDSRTPLLVLDQQQFARDVDEIAGNDYFQELQRQLARLRGKPRSGDR
jgi:pSer/pThr/pTyr-binding forkhead associated (FHA) protein